MPILALTQCILLNVWRYDTFMTCPLAYFQIFVIKQDKVEYICLIDSLPATDSDPSEAVRSLSFPALRDVRSGPL